MSWCAHLSLSSSTFRLNFSTLIGLPLVFFLQDERQGWIFLSSTCRCIICWRFSFSSHVVLASLSKSGGCKFRDMYQSSVLSHWLMCLFLCPYHDGSFHSCGYIMYLKIRSDDTLAVVLLFRVVVAILGPLCFQGLWGIALEFWWQWFWIHRLVLVGWPYCSINPVNPWTQQFFPSSSVFFSFFRILVLPQALLFFFHSFWGYRGWDGFLDSFPVCLFWVCRKVATHFGMLTAAFSSRRNL